MGKRKKRRGHYCYECGQVRANEKFSGKGHRQHICKDCKKGRNRQKKEILTEEENALEGIPWLGESEFDDEMYLVNGEMEHQEAEAGQVMVQLPIELTKKLTVFGAGTAEGSVKVAIALSLFAAKVISLEKAAYIAEVDYTEFMYLLQSNGIPWEAEDSGRDAETEECTDDLLRRVDIIVEQEDMGDHY